MVFDELFQCPVRLHLKNCAIFSSDVAAKVESYDRTVYTLSVIKAVKVLSCSSQVKCLETRLKQVLLVAEQYGELNEASTTFSDTLLVTCSRVTFFVIW